MSSEVVAALWGAGFGAVLAFVLTAGLSLWLHHRQRQDAEKDWYRDKQLALDRQAEDFVIEVQAFAQSSTIAEPRTLPDPWKGGVETQYVTVFNSDRCAELIAKATAFHARVEDPDLKVQVANLRGALVSANQQDGFGSDGRRVVKDSATKFYQRIAELYGTGKRQSVPGKEPPGSDSAQSVRAPGETGTGQNPNEAAPSA